MNNYYCLILPNFKVKLEAVEEIFREQEAIKNNKF